MTPPASTCSLTGAPLGASPPAIFTNSFSRGSLHDPRLVVLMACRTGCPTQDHDTYGACLRGANIQIDRFAISGNVDTRLEKRKDETLGRYKALRESGFEPPSIKKSNLDAFEASI